MPYGNRGFPLYAQPGAIGIAFSVMTVIQAMGFFFGNGAGNSMSRELGKHNDARAARLLSVGFVGAFALNCLLRYQGLASLAMIGLAPVRC